MQLLDSADLQTECHRTAGILSIIGDKWTVMIIMALCQQSRRFNDLKRTIGGISQQMLTRTLKALEREGMIARTVHPTLPPQVEYALTPLGRSLSKPVQKLGDWARAHRGEIEANRSSYDHHANTPKI